MNVDQAFQTDFPHCLCMCEPITCYYSNSLSRLHPDGRTSSQHPRLLVLRHILGACIFSTASISLCSLPCVCQQPHYLSFLLLVCLVSLNSVSVVSLCLRCKNQCHSNCTNWTVSIHRSSGRSSGPVEMSSYVYGERELQRYGHVSIANLSNTRWTDGLTIVVLCLVAGFKTCVQPHFLVV